MRAHYIRSLFAALSLLTGLVLAPSLTRAQAPANDTCAGATALANGVTLSMDTGSATDTGDPVPVCAASTGKGVWFTFTPPSNGTLTVKTCGSNYDTVMQIYTGGC